jgi:haloalkane dehalogenase
VTALDELDGIAYRESGPESGPAVLLVHGYPESSYMWRAALDAAGEAGWHAVAPDLTGFGDSPPQRPGTWERQMEVVDRVARSMGPDPLVLCVHDWGALIGLRWAAENPARVRALVISSGGFFPDGKWHGMAKALRTEGTGEELIDGMTRESFGAMLAGLSEGIGPDAADEYWKAFADADRRASQLELYRSGDFEKLRGHDGALAAMGVPVLLLWGEDDPFAPLAGAHRFKREIPAAELIVLDGARHFVWEDEPERASAELVGFLDSLG